ncbi:MAG TPA: glycine cleavage system protein GcvH [Deltaproteobacteria bacterium]|nr:MAG: glycine cleavage system protein H [Deltaproteobacteria bacterium GWA2_45_12]HBF14004.1 glycine cleavage system protein GcvH [Deltaproteobacteria bacterium]
MEINKELRYTKEHEWIRLDGNKAVVGITDFAQEQLGDVVMVELPKEGALFAKNETFGVVESVKSVSDVYVPVSGKVLEFNSTLIESPGLVNEDCYNEGWLIKLELTHPKELEGLLDAKAYEAYLKDEGKI